MMLSKPAKLKVAQNIEHYQNLTFMRRNVEILAFQH